MTLSDDIEDLVGSSDPQVRSSNTVRIRKVRQKSTSSSCDKESCDCESQNQQTCDKTTVSQRPVNVQDPVTSNSNDLNPGDYVIYVKTWGCSHNNSDSEYMAGLLSAAGFQVTTTDYPSSHLVLLNSCTVKGPSEQHFRNEIDRATNSGKRVVLAGCVPQSDASYRKSETSVIGVNQIDRVVDVVEETLQGNTVVITKATRNGVKAAGAELSLPKIRKNKLIEIVPVSSGCLNNCSYCKTKHARGQLVSYPIDSIVSRISHVTNNEGVKEIWLTSEDLGCWGLDIGSTLVELLESIINVLPKHVMMRLGMSNPPYFIGYLPEISRILSHRNVYEFLHIPVQSGSDSVLLEMKREYSRKEFTHICEYMLERHPSMTIATDVICGYPTETDQDFKDTYELVDKFRFPVLFINQFYPRPGTAAAKLKRIPTDVVKTRTKRLNELFQSYHCFNTYDHVQRVLVTEIAHDKIKYVGHNKSYQQVLVDKNLVLGKHDPMGEWVDVRILSHCKFALIGGEAVIVKDLNTEIGSSLPRKYYYSVKRIVFAAILLVFVGVCFVYVWK